MTILFLFINVTWLCESSGSFSGYTEDTTILPSYAVFLLNASRKKHLNFGDKYLYLLLFECKGKDKVVPLHCMKAYKGSRSLYPHIQVSSSVRLYPGEKNRYPMNTGLSGYENRSGRFWGKKKFVSIVQPIAWAIPTLLQTVLGQS
jgi:hypothetical protein